MATNVNFVRIQRREIINTEEDQKNRDVERFREQMKNGNREDDRRRGRTRKLNKNGRAKEKKETKKWFGIESEGRMMKKIKWLLGKVRMKSIRKNTRGSCNQ